MEKRRSKNTHAKYHFICCSRWLFPHPLFFTLLSLFLIHWVSMSQHDAILKRSRSKMFVWSLNITYVSVQDWTGSTSKVIFLFEWQQKCYHNFFYNDFFITFSKIEGTLILKKIFNWKGKIKLCQKLDTKNSLSTLET